MCSGTITSHGCKLRDPRQQLSNATVVLGMGKLRHGEGACRVNQSKIQESQLLALCIIYLHISSLVCSTEVASCMHGLAQVQDQAGKAAKPEPLLRPQNPTQPLHLHLRHFQKCCSEKNFPAPSPETEPQAEFPPEHQE